MKLTGFSNNRTVSLGNNDCTVRALASVTGKDYVRFFLFSKRRVAVRTADFVFINGSLATATRRSGVGLNLQR